MHTLRLLPGLWLGLGLAVGLSDFWTIEPSYYRHTILIRPPLCRLHLIPIHYCMNLGLPLHIRQSQTYSSFRRHLKMYDFLSAHLGPYRPL